MIFGFLYLVITLLSFIPGIEPISGFTTVILILSGSVYLFGTLMFDSIITEYHRRALGYCELPDFIPDVLLYFPWGNVGVLLWPLLVVVFLVHELYVVACLLSNWTKRQFQYE